MRKLLGYRLKEKQYKDAVQKIIPCLDEIDVNCRAAKKLKQAGVMHWFEEVYKEKKLEIGKWYKVTNIQNGCLGFKGIGMCTEESIQSGLYEEEKGYNLKEPNGIVWRVNGFIKPAPLKEIETELIKEAKKRGFKEGVIVDNSDLKGVIWKQDGKPISSNCFYFELHNNKLMLGQKWIFKDGKWAEILPTETLNGKTAIIDGVEYELKIKN